MISVIVPVYNVEPYLPGCLDSILSQTYRDLEILLIDDGSTDRGGTICDEYAAKDPRIRVFHTENRGLSAARNRGLDEAKGEYVGFVDSDDRIEPDMYEYLLEAAERTGADVVECGAFKEFPERTAERKRESREMSGPEAVLALLQGELADGVWDKLYRRRCFDRIRFPEGRVFEEVATTWRVFATVERVCSIPEAKYHWLQREGSLSCPRNMRSLAGYWRSHYERYESLRAWPDENTARAARRWCARAAGRMWAHWCDCSGEERESHRDLIREIHGFAKGQIPLFGERDWDLSLRIGAFFPHFCGGLSFRTAWLLNRLSKIPALGASERFGVPASGDPDK